MELSRSIVRQFADLTNTDNTSKVTGDVYGTVVEIEGQFYAQIDGSEADILTPISSTIEVSDGDRVIIEVRNHIATATGNLDDPSAGVVRVGNVEARIENLGTEIRLEVDNELEQLRAAITLTETTIRSEVEALGSSLGTDISELETGLEGALGDISGLQTSVGNIEGDISGLEGDVDSIRGEITDIQGTVGNLESSIEQTATEIRSEVSAQVTDINATIETMNGEVETLQADVVTLSSSISQTADQIRMEISSEVEGINSSIDGLAKNQSEFSIFQQTVEGFEFMNKGGTAKISGGCLDLTGCITFSDFVEEDKAKLENAGVKYQYSADGETDWHDAMESTDYYRRESLNGGEWGAAYQFRGRDGEDGKDGSDGSDANIPTYITETIIGSGMIQAPQIYGNDIHLYPNNSSDYTGSFNIWGMQGTTQHHMLAIAYEGHEDASYEPTIDFYSPAQGTITFNANQPYGWVEFYGTVDFSNATAKGLYMTFS